MTEREYLLVQSLTRLRGGFDLLQKSFVDRLIPDTKDTLGNMLVQIQEWICTLEDQVQEARDRNP